MAFLSASFSLSQITLLFLGFQAFCREVRLVGLWVCRRAVGFYNWWSHLWMRELENERKYERGERKKSSISYNVLYLCVHYYAGSFCIILSPSPLSLSLLIPPSGTAVSFTILSFIIAGLYVTQFLSYINHNIIIGTFSGKRDLMYPEISLFAILHFTVAL